MMREKLAIFLLGFILRVCACNAQTAAKHNLNIGNGLTSTHVYSTIVDKYGYLWLATTTGAFRYNGYELKKMAAGDIWGIHEDSKSRIWLLSISDEMRYLLNGRSHKAYKLESDQILVPSDIHDHKNGIYFYSSYFGNNWCFEQNDTVFTYRSNYSLFSARAVYSKLSTPGIYTIRLKGGKLQEKKLIDTYNDESSFLRKLYDALLISHNYENTMYFRDLKTGQERKLIFKDEERIYTAYRTKKNTLVITNQALYKIDDSFRKEQFFDYADLFGLNGEKDQITHYQEDDLWNVNISTEKSGHYILYNRSGLTKSEHQRLSSFHHMGHVQHQGNYWWSELEKSIAIVSKGNDAKYIKCQPIRKIGNIRSFDKDRSLIISYSGLYWLHHKNSSIEDIFGKVNYYKFLTNDGKYRTFSKKNVNWDLFPFGYYDAAVYKDRIFVANRYQGFSSICVDKDTAIIENIDKHRYNRLIHDLSSKTIYAYTDKRVLIYDLLSGKKIAIFGDLRHILGSGAIEHVAISNTHGNIFIKGSEGLIMYDRSFHIVKKLFRNINLTDARISCENDTLVIGGKFGVLVAAVTGPLTLSKPVIFNNVKALTYNYLFDVSLLSGGVILNTDKGVFAGYFADEHAGPTNFSANTSTGYKFIVSHLDTTRNIISGDTLVVDQRHEQVQFDITNPSGVGTIHWHYKWQENRQFQKADFGELNMSAFDKGRYHTITLIASDDLWRSDELKVTLYIIPYWWETSFGKKLIIAIMVLGIIIIIAGAVMITRRVITVENNRRNKLMELELRSVYLQINPHFIFNTLNAALQFIRKQRTEDAHAHIMRFSKLLRGILKSSRNRFITLEEEITNLENYIHLQQARFDECFTFVISVYNLHNPRKVGIPSLLFQPIVENSINHGLIPKNGKGHLTIEFLLNEEGALICTIDDNGIGRARSMIEASQATLERDSYGTKLVQELIEVFNKHEKMGIELTYIDKTTPLTGTKVVIIIRNPHVYA